MGGLTDALTGQDDYNVFKAVSFTVTVLSLGGFSGLKLFSEWALFMETTERGCVTLFNYEIMKRFRC